MLNGGWLISDNHKDNPVFVLVPLSSLFPPTKLFLGKSFKMNILRKYVFVL